MAAMTTQDPAQALETARRQLKEIGWSDRVAWRAAVAEMLAAERVLAASQGEQYAEVLDLGFRWDIGAPLPHLLCNGSRAFVVCFAERPDQSFDGTSVEIVSPDDERTDWFGIIELWGCASVRLGAPNDEAIEGHPLEGKGLAGYVAHEVRNSAWLEEHIRINSVHPNHSDEIWRARRHYFLMFHDEMFEAIADGIQGRVVHSSLRCVLDQLTTELIEQPYRRNQLRGAVT
jgi:hypothetical protein